MRRCSVVLIVALPLVMLAAGPTAPQDPAIGLRGSAHDFSQESWSGGDLCIACHAAGRDELPDAPLWNPSADFNRTFADALQDRDPEPPLAHSHNRYSPDRAMRPRPYGAGHDTLPGAGTMVCMRCHDGTMAADMFGGLAAPQAVNIHHRALRSTGHGGTNHPVGVVYPQLDEDYRPVTAVVADGLKLPGGRVECISCHDPHNELGAPDMLIKSNEGSALCLACHRK